MYFALRLLVCIRRNLSSDCTTETGKRNSKACCCFYCWTHCSTRPANGSRWRYYCWISSLNLYSHTVIILCVVPSITQTSFTYVVNVDLTCLYLPSLHCGYYIYISSLLALTCFTSYFGQCETTSSSDNSFIKHIWQLLYLLLISVFICSIEQLEIEFFASLCKILIFETNIIATWTWW